MVFNFFFCLRNGFIVMIYIDIYRFVVVFKGWIDLCKRLDCFVMLSLVMKEKLC